MNKKILLVSILAVFMLLTISFASAVTTNTTKTERKESPLYSIRTRQAIREKISNIIENIKAKFLGERIFFLPVHWLRNSDLPDPYETEFGKTCESLTLCLPGICVTLKICITQIIPCDKEYLMLNG